MDGQLKIPTRIKVIITISILLNAFTLGALTMFFINKNSEKNKTHRPFHAELDRRQNSDIFRKLRKLRKQNRPYFKEIKEKRNDVLDTIAAEQFDEEEYDEKVQELALAHQAMFESMSSEMKSLAKESNHKERKKIAKFLKKHRPPGIPKLK